MLVHFPVELKGAYGSELIDGDVVAPKAPDGVVMDGFSAAQEEALSASQEKFGFQAEVSRLMDILINSLCKTFISRDLLSNNMYFIYVNTGILNYVRRQEQRYLSP